MRTPAPLRRLDGVALAVSRWERDRAPRVVRTVAAHPAVVAVVAGVLVVAAASVHVARYPDQVEADAVARAPVTDVGPPPGADIPAYTEARHELLAQLPGDEVLRAIVSLRGYVTVGDLPVTGEGVRVEHLHVRLPAEGEPRVVPADGADAALRELFADGRADLEAEIADLEGYLAEDLGDAAFEQEFEAELDRLRELGAVAGDDAPVVFAAVVVATAAELRVLVDDPHVRLVDVAGPPERTGDTRFVGVEPVDPERASTERGVAPVPAP